jgi:hypothetical protein
VAAAAKEERVTRSWFAAGLLGSLVLAVPAQAEVFGQPLQGLAAVSLADVLAKPEAGRTVRLEGVIEKVCRNKGCWLALRQGEASVHVTFAGYAFFVPKDSAGRDVALEGTVVVKQPRPDDVAHLQGEGAGASAAASVSIEATGVELR